VEDVAASQAFYETIAPYAGFRLNRAKPERAQFTAPSGSFSVVAGKPTEPFHLAFPAGDNGTVDEFHQVRDRCRLQGQRRSGPRYYGAFVLDPDGNNVELVNHNRGSQPYAVAAVGRLTKTLSSAARSPTASAPISTAASPRLEISIRGG
jgi:hypothetical protein